MFKPDHEVSVMGSALVAQVAGHRARRHGVLTISDHPYLQTKRITTSSFHLNTSTLAHTFGPTNHDGISALVQIRHRMRPVSASIRPRNALQLPIATAAPPTDDGWAQGIECTFDEPVVGVAPGQVAAVYLEDRCIGSGVIDETWCQAELD